MKTVSLEDLIVSRLLFGRNQFLVFAQVVEDQLLHKVNNPIIGFNFFCGLNFLSCVFRLCIGQVKLPKVNPRAGRVGIQGHRFFCRFC